MSASDAALLIFMLLLTWSFYRAHNDPDSDFNLLDLIMENKRVSRIGFGFVFALIVTSWVLILVARGGKMSLDIIFPAYLAAWVAPIVAKLFSQVPPAEKKVTKK